MSNGGVTWVVWRYMGADQNGVELYYGVGHCLSTDTKPTQNMYNGSTLLEMDTSKVCVFDAANTQWREL